MANKDFHLSKLSDRFISKVGRRASKTLSQTVYPFAAVDTKSCAPVGRFS